MSMYYVYILRCADNTLYTGIALDWKRRFEEHKSKGKKCAKYTRAHTAVSVEAVWQTESKSDALKLERYIKSLTKTEKENLILSPNDENVLDLSKYVHGYDVNKTED